MLQRITQHSYRHPWRTLAIWLIALAATVALSGSLGERFSGGGHDGSSDSERAYRVLERDFPGGGTETADVVVHAAEGLDAVASQVASLESALRIAARGGAVEEPVVAPDGTTAIVRVAMPDADARDADGNRLLDRVVDDVRAAAAQARTDALTIELGSPWFTEGDVPAYAEQIGLAVAIVVLLLVFGSLLASGVTLLPAILGVVGSGAVVTIVSHVIATPDVTATVATMIGLGVGIDYGLFVVTRFRRELAGRAPDDALRATMSTAGRAVVLAGGTVGVSLLGMLLIGLEFLHGLSVGASVAVGVAVLSATTLLPALLRWSTPSMQRRAVRRSERSGRRGQPDQRARIVRAETWWHRWGRAVTDRPLVALVGGLGVLVLLALPAASMRLATADAGNDPLGTTTRSAYDLTAEAFGAGANGPLVITLEQSSAAAANRVVVALRETPGVAAVGTPSFASNGTTAAILLIPTTAPQSVATEALVQALRTDVLPPIAPSAHVGGATATNVDFANILRDRLPLFVGGVLACSFLLLLIVFRSILVPLKAVLLNLISIGAAVGATVALFQWGWFGGLVGIEHGAPIEPWAPMLLFAIVFGLSMDYEVFLLSAIKEHHDHHGDNRAAVVEGIAATGRVITAAAAIMVAVFGSFLGAELRGVQLIGFGLAAAVLIDATLVRMVLVPATMQLLGDRNWWLPRALDARLPRVQLEAPTADGDTDRHLDGHRASDRVGDQVGDRVGDRVGDEVGVAG